MSQCISRNPGSKLTDIQMPPSIATERQKLPEHPSCLKGKRYLAKQPPSKCSVGSLRIPSSFMHCLVGAGSLAWMQ